MPARSAATAKGKSLRGTLKAAQATRTSEPFVLLLRRPNASETWTVNVRSLHVLQRQLACVRHWRDVRCLEAIWPGG